MFSLNHTLSFPWEVEWSVTWACNAHCSFCSTGNYNRNLHSQDINIISTRIIEAQPLAITLSGGEPLVHPEIDSIINVLVSSGIPLNLTTNGLLLHRVKPENISKLNWIRISLHSCFRDTSKKIMGERYNLEKVLNNIKRIGLITKKFSIFMILTKENCNVNELNELLKISKSLGAANIEIGIIKLLGWANTSMLEPNLVINEALEHIGKYANALELNVVLPNINTKKHYCVARAKNVAIFPDGSVRSCSFDNDIAWGNISDEPLIDIWSRRPFLDEYCDRCSPGGYQTDSKRIISIKNI